MKPKCKQGSIVNRNGWSGLAAVGGVLFLASLWVGVGEDAAQPVKGLPSVEEKVRTPDWHGAEIDSAAIWEAPDGKVLLFASGKTSNEVLVCNAATGELLDRIGQRPGEPNPLSRPNGLAVEDDYLFVVERDNRRVQVYSLPGFESLGVFGQNELWYPYGIDLYRNGDAYEVYVTDNYGVDSEVGQGAPLDLRVKHFRVSLPDGKIAVTLEESFGAVEGPGVLNEVETLLVDAEADRVYLCDEAALSVKIYQLDGSFSGTIFGEGAIEFEPEGMILVEETPLHPDGVLVVTDQGEDLTVFRIFSRGAGEFLGSFTGAPELANTDGICFLHGSFGPFERGGLFAVHADFRVQGYSWADVEALFKKN